MSDAPFLLPLLMLSPLLSFLIMMMLLLLLSFSNAANAVNIANDAASCIVSFCRCCFLLLLLLPRFFSSPEMSARQAAAPSASPRGPHDQPAEIRSFLRPNNVRAWDEVETGANPTQTLAQTVLGWIFDRQRLLLLLLHLNVAIVAVVAVIVLATLAPPGCCAEENDWAGDAKDYDSEISPDKDDLSPPLWKMTRRGLSRTVRKAVRNVFLRPHNDTFVFKVLVQELANHLLHTDNKTNSLDGHHDKDDTPVTETYFYSSTSTSSTNT